ncbi:MAG: hypothetical protein AB8B34_07410 [Prochlorococcus sp.]
MTATEAASNPAQSQVQQPLIKPQYNADLSHTQNSCINDDAAEQTATAIRHRQLEADV